jgi:hypothetical protein
MSGRHSIEAQIAASRDADADWEIRGSAARALKQIGTAEARAAVEASRQEQNRE